MRRLGLNFMKKSLEANSKALLALEALKGEKTMAQIAVTHGIRPSQI